MEAVDKRAYIAPGAQVVGDVELGANRRTAATHVGHARLALADGPNPGPLPIE